MTTVTATPLAAPNFSAVTPVKPVPVITTLVPPVVGPAVGEIELTVGTGGLTVRE
ncbi:hypothetical protein D3C72_1009300 [compost metagenome]